MWGLTVGEFGPPAVGVDDESVDEISVKGNMYVVGVVGVVTVGAVEGV